MSSETFREWWNEHLESMLEMDWDYVAEAAWNAAEKRMKDEVPSCNNLVKCYDGIYRCKILMEE